PAPCECEICQTQYRPVFKQRFYEHGYARTLTDVEAEEKLANYVTQANLDREAIHATLQQHGNAISTWWRTRRRSGREAILRKVAPNSQIRRKPCLTTNLKGQNFMLETQADRLRNRQHFLLPYLNIPTLASHPATMIGLAEARTISSLEEWAPFDNEQLTLYWECGWVDLEYNAGCVMLYGQSYGALRKWERSVAHRCDAIGFPRASLLIEAQATLMSILRRILEQVVELLPVDSQVGMEKMTRYLHDAWTSPQAHLSWSSYVHQPFMPAPKLDLDASLVEVQARRDNVGDQLWLLQTEPAYFRRYIGLVRQLPGSEMLYSQNAMKEITLAEIKAMVEMYWFWQGILVELEHTRHMYRVFRDHIAPGSPLPPKVNFALGALEALLVQGIDKRGKQLQALLRARPAFYHMYHHSRSSKTEMISSLKDSPNKPNPADAYKTDRLWWCLGNLLGEPRTPTRIPHTVVLGLLDDHLQIADQKEIRKIDGILLERLSDYATMHEIWEGIRLHRPSYTERTMHDCKNSDDRSGWRRVRLAIPEFGALGDVTKALNNFDKTKAPAGGKNYQWLTVFDANHDMLKTFWASMHELFKTWHARCGFSEEDTANSLQVLGLWKSEDYHERLASKRQTVLSDISKRKTLADNDVFLPMPFTDTSNPNTQIVERKSKTKTRGETSNSSEAKKDESTTMPEPSIQYIGVPKSAIKVFRRMFPVELQERSAEVDWKDFVGAMCNAGFAARSGGGSIMIFEQDQGKIIFHRPHPDSTIDAIMLQSMGRRMNKWFGWTRESFVLAD
ncbi:hypothetical protein P153DRAFT_254026, partial [Dothidotthia symphoricarpi CBS 119687]